MNTYKIEITTDDCFSNDELKGLLEAVITFMNDRNMTGHKIVEAYSYDSWEQEYSYRSGISKDPFER